MSTIGLDGYFRGQYGVELSTPEAVTFSEYSLLVTNLEGALGLLEAVHRKYPSTPESIAASAVPEALFRDAIVQLMGCFGDPKQHKLDRDQLFGRDPDALRRFDYLKNLRDSYAAHNFGPARLCSVAVKLHSESGFSVRAQVLRFSLPSRDEIQRFIAMFRLALAAAKKLVFAAEMVVVRQLQVMGVEAIKALPEFKMRIPDHDEIRMSRRQFRGETKGRAPSRKGRSG